MASGAIANLVDEVGFAAVNSEGRGAKVSVDMNIAFITPAKLGVPIFSLLSIVSLPFLRN